MKTSTKTMLYLWLLLLAGCPSVSCPVRYDVFVEGKHVTVRCQDKVLVQKDCNVFVPYDDGTMMCDGRVIAHLPADVTEASK